MSNDKYLNSKLEYNEIFPNYGYIFTKMPNILLDELSIPINNLKQDFAKGIKYHDYLVGEIHHEYDFDLPSSSKQYIQSLVEQLEKKSNYIKHHINSPSTQLRYDLEVWVNFQQKHEYNPLHHHTGFYSFVIWYKIPYLQSDENKASHQKLEGKSYNGSFCFVYPNPINNLSQPIIQYDLNMDKSQEGHIIIFPASLNHIVYPFYTSDEPRITIAGNIVLSK
jgi:hypothetical protein